MTSYAFTVYIEVKSQKGSTHARNKLLRGLAQAELNGHIDHFSVGGTRE